MLKYLSIHNLIAIGLIFLLIFIFGYSYITHFLLEFAFIFVSFIVFIALISIPTTERTPFLQVLGTTFLSSAILDIPHTIYYPGFPEISNTSLAITYWMLARLIQSVGMLIAVFYMKSSLISKKFRSISFSLPLFSLLLIFILRYLPTNLFYSEKTGTTFLKSLLEIFYSLLFFVFAIKNRKNPYLFSGGLSFSLSELSFMKYLSPFEWTLWMGHTLKIVGVFNIAFFTLVNFIYNPLKDYRILNEEYKREGSKLSENISNIINTQERILNTLYLALNCKDEEQINKLLGEFFEKEKIPIAVFFNKNLCYKNPSSLPEKIEDYNLEEFDKIEKEDVTVMIKRKDEPTFQLYKIFILSLFSIYSNLRYTQILKDTGEKRESFIREVSHEFRNPLNVISGYIQLLKSGYYEKFPNRLKEVIEEMEISTEKISNLVDKLLKVGEEDGKDSHSR